MHEMAGTLAKVGGASSIKDGTSFKQDSGWTRFLGPRPAGGFAPVSEHRHFVTAACFSCGHAASQMFSNMAGFLRRTAHIAPPVHRRPILVPVGVSVATHLTRLLPLVL